MGLNAKQIFHTALFGRWRRPQPLVEGYAILLQMPMDMPFLLRFALEGLRHMDTEHCKQILVIPDGWGDDGGRALREVVAACDDPRVEIATLGPGVHFYIHQFQMRRSHRTAANWTHWAMIVAGTAGARCEYAFLHDADAFFVDADALERQYRECRDRACLTLGVEVRTDPFFERIGYAIPGTWELMYSVRWARKRNPFTLKGLWRLSPHGRHEFDTMLYPQYLDYPTGKIGVIEPPPRLVHFHGAVTTFRVLKDLSRRPIVDMLFRLLLLSILEDLLPAPDGKRIMPTPEELTRGLNDPSAPITYNSETATREYPIFRGQLEELCESPSFAGSRSARVRELIRPFDEHFASRRAGTSEPASAETPQMTETSAVRRHGLG
jgi:hypothetical protein